VLEADSQGQNMGIKYEMKMHKEEWESNKRVEKHTDKR
jgi:hypothetical protein